MFRWLPFRSDDPSAAGPPEGAGDASVWDSTQTSPPGADEVRSPCTSVCELDRRGECIGCGRTVDEIGLWTSLDAAARRDVIEKAGARQRRRAARAHD